MAVSVVSTTAITGAKGVTTITSGNISVQSGDIVVVMWTATNGANSTYSSITDNQSGSWTKVENPINTGTNHGLCARRAITTTSSTFTVTVGHTGGITSNLSAVVVVLRGGTLTGANLQTAIDATGSTTPSVTSSTASADGCVVGSVQVAGPSGDTFTADSDTTNGTWSSATTSGTTGGSAAANSTTRVQTKLITGSGTQTYDPTLGTARKWSAMALYIPAAVTTTPVSKTLATSWHVVGQVSKALSTTWNVLENLTPVSKALATSWHVLQSVTTSDSHLWHVNAQVSASRSTLWHVRSVVTAARSTLWNVLAVVSPKTLATLWNVNAQVTAARSTLWNVVGRVSAARSTLWHVASTVSPKTLSTTWNVRAVVTAARSTTWNVAASVSKALGTTWNVLTLEFFPVSNALSTSWHVISQVAKATSTSWHVRMQVAASRSTSWHVLSRVAAATRSTLWNVVGRVTATRSTTWNVAAIVSASRSTTWNVRTIVAATRSTLWNVRAFVSASRSTLWNVMLPDLQAVSRALSVTWNTFTRLGRTFSTYWGVTTPTVTLTVNNAAHTSASSQPSLTITHVIAQVNGASHGLRSGEPTLVQNSTLQVRDASHRLESDRVHLKQWKQAYLFRTPKTGAVAFHTDRLVVRLGLPAGVTLLVNGGIVVESQYPTEEQLAAADAAYVGGHEYVITPSAAAILTTAGYGSFLSPTEVLQEV